LAAQVANQHSHNLASFLVNDTTGFLTAAGTAFAPSPSCVKIVPRHSGGGDALR
jgi:6-phosphogluconolactonase (cycloisomerase 2 family)